VNHQTRFLRNIDVHGEKFVSNDNVDTVPPEVWDRVRQALTEQRMTQRAFAEAMPTKFCGSTMWKHSPSRGRLHRAAAVLDDQVLHDLTNNDVLWDKVVEITSVGEQDVYDLKVPGTQSLVAQGISIQAAHRADTG
jgi:replicative DNA helicase